MSGTMEDMSKGKTDTEVQQLHKHIKALALSILSRARGAQSPVKPVATVPTRHGPCNPLVR